MTHNLFIPSITLQLKMFNAREKTSFNQVHSFNTSGLCSLHPVNSNDRKTLAVNFRNKSDVDHSENVFSTSFRLIYILHLLGRLNIPLF